MVLVGGIVDLVAVYDLSLLLSALFLGLDLLIRLVHHPHPILHSHSSDLNPTEIMKIL